MIKAYLTRHTDDGSYQFIDIPDMPPLESDEEEVKEGKGLKILLPNKLLTRLPLLLTQIKAGNNSYKLKKLNETNIGSLVSA